MTESEFQTLVLENQDRVYNTCLGFMKDAEEAKDMSQEVFIHVYQNIKKFKGESLLSTWIYRITVNKCLEEMRKKGRQKRAAHLEEHFRSRYSEQSTRFLPPWCSVRKSATSKNSF